MKNHTDPTKSKRPKCQDCGKNVTPTQGIKRCWDCELKHRSQERQHRFCEVEGCGLPHKALGFCRKHYKAEHQKRRKPWTIRPFLRGLPCIIFGYDRIRSHVHRMNGDLGYTNGNVIPVCARCHDEIHVGVTTPPSAMTYSSLGNDLQPLSDPK